MGQIIKTAILAVVLVLSAPRMILAGDYITDAVTALQQRPVYVAPGTEGTDNDTAAKLQARLRKDDNIVLVMLPASAEAELGVNISTIANRLSEELGNQRIIGLSVGKKVVGLAPSLPAGIAADLMKRAESVSNDPFTALSTFVQNVHIWEAANPQPMPVPFIPPEQGEVPWFPTIPVVPSLVLGGLYWVIKRRIENEKKKEKTRFNAPNKVGELLAQIARERGKLNDLELNQTIYQMCLDMEKYFQSFSKDTGRDARAFQDRLTEVFQVLEKYIEIQNNERYYREPKKELSRGKESITGFSRYLLESIQSGRQADLIDYSVNTNILDAQQYRR